MVMTHHHSATLVMPRRGVAPSSGIAVIIAALVAPVSIALIAPVVLSMLVRSALVALVVPTLITTVALVALIARVTPGTLIALPVLGISSALRVGLLAAALLILVGLLVLRTWLVVPAVALRARTCGQAGGDKQARGDDRRSFHEALPGPGMGPP